MTADPAAFLERVELLRAGAGRDLTPLAAAILLASHEGAAADSRSFARIFGVAHALVLRECTAMLGAGLLREVNRDERNQRLAYAIGAEGVPMVGTL